MVATFTPQPELQSFVYNLSKNALLPAAQFKGAIKYEGRLHVRIDPVTRAVSMEPLDETWANIGIVENDFFAVEGGGRSVHGCWFLRAVVAGEERNVDPLDPSPEILNSLPWAASSDPIYPNRLRGVRDQIVDVRLSDVVFFNSNNHRSRGTLGQTWGSDNLRQLTFDGAVSTGWTLNCPVSGGTSGAVGTVVGLSPGITKGGAGHWVIVDMGVDYAGAEFTLGEAVTCVGATGTLRSDALGARSISPLFRSQASPEFVLPLPPNQAALQHWFDFSDPTTMFTDVAGTIPVAVSGDPIRHIVNKGTDGTPLVQAGSAMTYEPGVLAGFSVGQWLTTEDVSATIAAAGGAGWTMAGISRRQSGDPSAALEAFMDWGSSNMRFAAAGNMTGFHISIGTLDTGVPHVTGTWYAQLYAGDTASTIARASGAAEVVGAASSGATIGGGSLLRLGEVSGAFPGQNSEILVYSTKLNPTDRAAFFTYADAKAGTLPHT